VKSGRGNVRSAVRLDNNMVVCQWVCPQAFRRTERDGKSADLVGPKGVIEAIDVAFDHLAGVEWQIFSMQFQ